MSNQAQTEVKPLWNGISIPVIGVTGPVFSGKSIFASSIRPEETLYIDGELSTASYQGEISGIPYKRRVDLFEELRKEGKENPSPIDVFLCWKKIMDSAKDGEFQVAVTDPWDFIQAGLHDYIESKPDLYNRTSAQYKKMTPMLWGDVKTWLHTYTAMFSKRMGDGSVVFINHEGEEFKGGTTTGKKKTKGVNTIYQIASLYLNLERKPDKKGKIPDKPAGYACESHRGKSRLVRTKMVDGEIEFTPILPARIPDCTPAKIREYIGHPAGEGKPKAGELAPDEEMTDDDRLLIKQNIVSNELEIENSKLARLEGTREAAMRNAERNSKVQNKAESKVADKPEPKPEVKAEPKQEENVVAPAEEKKPADDTPPFKENDAPAESTKETIYEILHKQVDELVDLGVSKEKLLEVAKKRKDADGKQCESFDDLKEVDAKEISKKFWDIITKKR
jgi:hypothetical protein